MKKKSPAKKAAFPLEELFDLPLKHKNRLQQSIITDNNTLRAHYHRLAEGDIVIGRIRLKPTEEYLFLDLLERGVSFFPSALAQLASRSKTMQALLFSSFMLPNTYAIHDLHAVIKVLNYYQKQGITKVVTKNDRQNAGRGIHLWSSIEDVYTQASLATLPFPFVVQPFEHDCRDIRVIVLGDYIEAYWRHNPGNFRNNLHFGGESRPCKLTEAQINLCQSVMKRGKFPYAHIDIMINSADESFLAEINLRGGIHGAKINPTEYKERLDAIHRKAIDAARKK